MPATPQTPALPRRRAVPFETGQGTTPPTDRTERAMTNEIPRRRGTPAQRAIAVRAIRSIRRSRSITGLHCLHHAADELASFSRTALRDLAAHYFAVTAGCLELAASRAARGEVDAIRARLSAFGEQLSLVPLDQSPRPTPAQWRHVADDVVVELCALGQSVRLTREQMRVQSEVSPLLGLLAVEDAEREMQRSEILRLVDEVERGDVVGAREALRSTMVDVVARLELKRRSLLEQ